MTKKDIVNTVKASVKAIESGLKPDALKFVREGLEIEDIMTLDQLEQTIHHKDNSYHQALHLAENYCTAYAVTVRKLKAKYLKERK